ARTESWVTLRSRDRELEIRAEAEVVEVVIRLNDDAPVGKLGLEMRGVCGAVADLEGAEKRTPVRSIRMNGPDAPEVVAAQPLRFERAEHKPAVLQDDRVQGHAEVQVADALDIAAVVVHDKQLQCKRVRRVAGVDALEGVAVADERQSTAG